jgi:hypothetical protein
LLHAVSEVRVAPVEDRTEQVREHGDDVSRHALLGGSRRILLDRHRQVPDVTAGRRAEVVGHVGECQEPGPGQLIELADVLVVGQRGDGDVGDVVRVHEGLGRVAGGERDLAAQDAVQHVVLAEVLHEPGRADDREIGPGGAHRLLGVLGLLLTAAGEEHEARDPVLHGQVRERTDHLDRAGRRQVGVVRDVHRAHPIERWAPSGPVLPVEGGLAGAGPDPDGDAQGLQSLCDPAAGLASSAEHQCRVHRCILS